MPRPPGRKIGPPAAALILLPLLATTACNTGDDPGSGPRPVKPAASTPFTSTVFQPGRPLPLVGRKWVVSNRTNGQGDWSPPIEGVHFTIADDHSVSGSTGCHDFTGRVSFPAPLDKKIVFKNLTAVGENKCPEEEPPFAQSGWKEMLEQPDMSYTVYDGSRMEISNSAGLESSGFASDSAPLTPEQIGPVTGTKWFPDTPVRPVDRAPYFWIEEDGTVRGFGGCRRFTARARVSAADHTIDFSGLTRQAPSSCTTDEQRAYEKKFLGRLDGRWNYTHRFRMLILKGREDGSKPFASFTPGRPLPAGGPVPRPADPADRATDDDLAGATWTVPSAGSGGAPAPYFHIDEEGYLLGHTGCEVFAARARITPDRVRIQDLVEVTADEATCSDRDRTAGRDFLTRIGSGFTYARDARGDGWDAKSTATGQDFRLLPRPQAPAQLPH
ncbi:META domain-containing protein [Streptomyces sp. NPDC021093]|uniref:META domain-containing protein n=1 Tax=Streptomyces sp. NPDC021093 TaxID=3365112 RepID=UPI003791B0ED